jgi:hypothetical protein
VSISHHDPVRAGHVVLSVPAVGNLDLVHSCAPDSYLTNACHLSFRHVLLAPSRGSYRPAQHIPQGCGAWANGVRSRCWHVYRLTRRVPLGCLLNARTYWLSGRSVSRLAVHPSLSASSPIVAQSQPRSSNLGSHGRILSPCVHCPMEFSRSYEAASRAPYASE